MCAFFTTLDKCRQIELDSAHRELISLRKLHDKLYQEADKADIVHNQVCEELSQLERLAGVGGKQPSATDPVEISMKLNQKIVETTEKLRASTEQKMVFGHMIERLKMELLMTRKTDNESKQKQSTIQHDLATSALQVQQAEIELRVEEDKLEAAKESLGRSA